MCRIDLPDERAAARLYAHCALIDCMTACGGSQARLRLEEELGTDLARLLVAALSTNLRCGRRNGASDRRPSLSR